MFLKIHKVSVCFWDFSTVECILRNRNKPKNVINAVQVKKKKKKKRWLMFPILRVGHYQSGRLAHKEVPSGAK